MSPLYRAFLRSRSSEVFGFQLASWNGESLLPLGTAYEGQLYPGRTKTKQSTAPISVPEQVRPVIEAWKAICPDPSPAALMFPTFGRGKRKGQAVPRWGKNFLKWRIRLIARKLGIPDRLVTLPGDAADAGYRHAASWNSQGHAGHTSACQHPYHGRYLCAVDRRKCPAAVNSRTTAVLEGFVAPVANMGQQGRNIKRPEAIRRIARGGDCKLLILWLLR